MIIRKALLHALLIGVLIAVAAGGSFAQTNPSPDEPPRMNVLEYYMALPDKYLPLGGDGNARLNVISIKDVKNGYLRLEGIWEGFTEIALFRKPNGASLLGVINNYCGPGCKQQVYFLELAGDLWIERTNSVLPAMPWQKLIDQYQSLRSAEDEDFGEEPPIMLMLPHTGTTLKLIVQPEFVKKPITLAELIWENGKFNAVFPEAPSKFFSGNWLSDSEEISFALKLKVEGEKIKGDYLAVTRDASRVRGGVVVGSIRGDASEIEFSANDYPEEKGRAVITRSGDQLIWKIVEKPKVDYFLPNETALKPVKSSKNVLTDPAMPDPQ